MGYTIIVIWYYIVLTITYNYHIIKSEKRDSMNQSTLSVRVDTNDKKGFEAFCTNTGMNVSTAINMFIKAVLREQKLPFEIKTNDFDTYVCSKLKEAEDDMKKGAPTYSSEEVFSSLKDIIDNA